MAIEIVGGGEAEVSHHTFSMTALEWFRVFAFMFSFIS
jgi:hypothetical protein